MDFSQKINNKFIVLEDNFHFLSGLFVFLFRGVLAAKIGPGKLKVYGPIHSVVQY